MAVQLGKAFITSQCVLVPESAAFLLSYQLRLYHHCPLTIILFLTTLQAEVVNLAVRPETPAAVPDTTAHSFTTRAQLPLPWPSGSKAVRMAGMVVKKHRIAKRLMFLSVVPVSSPELPARAQASHLRRVWRNPDDPVGPPIEVQLIMGKTIEQALVREGPATTRDTWQQGKDCYVCSSSTLCIISHRDASNVPSTAIGSCCNAVHSRAPFAAHTPFPCACCVFASAGTDRL